MLDLLQFVQYKICENYIYQGVNNYRPQRSWGKVMFLHVSVILFTRGGLPHCMLGYPLEQTSWEQTPPRTRQPPGADNLLGADPQTRHPPDQHPPGADTPWEQTPPRPCTPQSRHPPEAEPPPLSVVHAGRYGQQAGGMHPTGMQSCYFGGSLNLTIRKTTLRTFM